MSWETAYESSRWIFCGVHVVTNSYQFFRELIDISEKSMSQMFTKTYGRLFTQNAHIFQELFVEFRRYYSGGSVSLTEVLSDFWSRLVEKVFSLVNPQYQFSDDYLECVSKHAEQLQPFGDVPRKLRVQVSRAFIAARALSQALATGRDIVNKVTKVRGSLCVRGLMRQWYCPLCRGLPSVRPCHSLCLNVMKGCLANQADLDTEWNNFIDALYQVSEKLEGPFNMELAADSISVKVSEAIMHMQENSVIMPALGLSPPSSSQSHGTSTDFSPRLSHERFAFTSTQVTELKERLRPMRGFWVSLPHTICNDEKIAADVTNEERCWNGQTRGRYLPDVTGDGLVSQINNPEVEVDIARPDVRTRQLIMELRVATNKLRHAQSGQDMDFMDSEFMDLMGGVSRSWFRVKAVSGLIHRPLSGTTATAGSSPRPARSPPAPRILCCVCPSCSLSPPCGGSCSLQAGGEEEVFLSCWKSEAHSEEIR
uniref:Glypican 2 n=1 Tax=Salarias fasciatus TaxID=181472 RepID=A0A672GYH5_SALFA